VSRLFRPVRPALPPEKIYATVKTGRMLTKDNIQFLTPAEIQEWADAAEEYKMLAGASGARA